MADFGISSSRPGRLVASGELTFETAARALRTGLDALTGQDECVIDLSRVTAGDSAGLAVMIEWLAAARSRGMTVRYEGVPDQMRAIARISNLEDLLIAR